MLQCALSSKRYQRSAEMISHPRTCAASTSIFGDSDSHNLLLRFNSSAEHSYFLRESGQTIGDAHILAFLLDFCNLQATDILHVLHVRSSAGAPLVFLNQLDVPEGSALRYRLRDLKKNGRRSSVRSGQGYQRDSLIRKYNTSRKLCYHEAVSHSPCGEP